MKLDVASQDAFSAKKELRGAVPLMMASSTIPELEALGLLGPSYSDFRVGRFHGLDEINLRWVSQDWFEYIPNRSNLFGFERYNGELIQPLRMFTDGGSIPRVAWIERTLSPWGYAPAYLIHDWEFDCHHNNLSPKSFEEVRDTMMEGVKTLMETGLGPKAPITFSIMYSAINSLIARAVWDGELSISSIPPSSDD